MATAWTVPKLVRWRVRDWASCFLACRYPLDDEEDKGKITYLSASPQSRMRNLSREKREEKKSTKKKLPKKSLSRYEKQGKLSLSPSPRHSKERPRKHSLSPQQSRKKSVSSEARRLSWQHFSDEDYIVFCLGDDGALDVVKEINKEANSNDVALLLERTPRSVNRKLCYDDKHEDEHNQISSKNENNATLHVHEDGEGKEEKKGEEEEEEGKEDEEEEEEGKEDEEEDNGQEQERIWFREESQMGCPRRLSCKDDDGEKVGGLAGAAEPSESSNSDGSTGSFAFPVLGWEWMGSPVQMPRSDDFSLRKQKALPLRFQCFRF